MKSNTLLLLVDQLFWEQSNPKSWILAPEGQLSKLHSSDNLEWFSLKRIIFWTKIVPESCNEVHYGNCIYYTVFWKGHQIIKLRNSHYFLGRTSTQWVKLLGKLRPPLTFKCHLLKQLSATQEIYNLLIYSLIILMLSYPLFGLQYIPIL